MRFSASRLKAWMDCPLAAHYRYDEHLPRPQSAAASFGTIIHMALAEYFTTRGNLDNAIRTFKRLWVHPEQAGVAPDYWPKTTSWGAYMGRGLELLHKVHDAHRWNTFTFLASEQPFLVPFGDHELTGIVDLLGTEKSGTGTELLKIVDFKTSTKDPTIAELALDIQFTAYHIAVSRREFWVGIDGNPDYNGLPNGEWLWETIGRDITKRCIWWSLHSGRQIDAGPRLVSDYARLYRLCCEIEHAINTGVHVPKIGAACTWCDYQRPCSMDIPIALEALTNPSDPNRWI